MYSVYCFGEFRKLLCVQLAFFVFFLLSYLELVASGEYNTNILPHPSVFEHLAENSDVILHSVVVRGVFKVNHECNCIDRLGIDCIDYLLNMLLCLTKGVAGSRSINRSLSIMFYVGNFLCNRVSSIANNT